MRSFLLFLDSVVPLLKKVYHKQVIILCMSNQDQLSHFFLVKREPSMEVVTKQGFLNKQGEVIFLIHSTKIKNDAR